jgi:hypothetical protein
MLSLLFQVSSDFINLKELGVQSHHLLNENCFRQTITAFKNVFFENLDYTLISQKPKLEMFELISNIGGLFGLFLGLY